MTEMTVSLICCQVERKDGDNEVDELSFSGWQIHSQLSLTQSKGTKWNHDRPYAKTQFRRTYDFPEQISRLDQRNLWEITLGRNLDRDIYTPK